MDPIWISGADQNDRQGMVGLAAYTANMIPELQDELLVCSFNTGRIRRMELQPPLYDRVRAAGAVDGDCRLGIAVAPDGSIYTSTINKIERLWR